MWHLTIIIVNDRLNKSNCSKVNRSKTLQMIIILCQGNIYTHCQNPQIPLEHWDCWVPLGSFSDSPQSNCWSSQEVLPLKDQHTLHWIRKHIHITTTYFHDWMKSFHYIIYYNRDYNKGIKI